MLVKDYFVSAGVVSLHEQVKSSLRSRYSYVMSKQNWFPLMFYVHFAPSSLTFTWILSNLLSNIRSLQLLKKSWTIKLAGIDGQRTPILKIHPANCQETLRLYPPASMSNIRWLHCRISHTTGHASICEYVKVTSWPRRVV